MCYYRSKPITYCIYSIRKYAKRSDFDISVTVLQTFLLCSEVKRWFLLAWLLTHKDIETQHIFDRIVDAKFAGVVQRSAAFNILIRQHLLHGVTLEEAMGSDYYIQNIRMFKTVHYVIIHYTGSLVLFRLSFKIKELCSVSDKRNLTFTKVFTPVRLSREDFSALLVEGRQSGGSCNLLYLWFWNRHLFSIRQHIKHVEMCMQIILEP